MPLCIGKCPLHRGILYSECLLSLYLSFLLHAESISLVGVELNGGLTEGDQVHVPSTQDGECHRHSHTHKEHHYHQRVLGSRATW